MSSKATLIGTLPDPDLNGLANAAQKFVDEPDIERTVIARVKTRKLEQDRETGEWTAKLGIVHIEVIGGSDERVIKQTLASACESRTGITQLDGFEQAFNQAFNGAFDPETGEAL